MKKILSILLLPVILLGAFAAQAKSISFSDTFTDPHREAIEYLQGTGMLQGFPDGTYRPNATLNRAELLKLAIAATNANGKFDDPTFAAYHNCFPDVQDEWFASYVCFAKSHGYVTGYADGNFHPEREVNKAEAVKIITLINELEDINEQEKIFLDVDKNSWYFPYLQIASSHNLLEETSGYYGPAKPMSRGLAAETIYRLITGKSSSSDPKITDTSTTSTADCSPLDTVIGTTITVSNVEELRAAVKEANVSGNTSILLEDGTYNFVGEGLWVSGANIIFRSESGKRDKVQLKGEGMYGNTTRIFFVAGDNITIADMTLSDVANHVIQIHGELDADNTILHNLHIKDGYEQLVKVSYDAGKMDQGADNGILECSILEYTAGIGPQYYIGGIDAHNAANWIVRNNIFSSIRSPEEEIAEHGVHFWSDSRNITVEDNILLNCDRGIGFGLGDRGAHGGIIRNNKIYHNPTRGDAGIILENANDIIIEDNIILMENDYPNAIEYRFQGTTGTQILNNISNKAIKQRDGASATLTGNTTNAKITDYTDPKNGDFTPA